MKKKIISIIGIILLIGLIYIGFLSTCALKKTKQLEGEIDKVSEKQEELSNELEKVTKNVVIEEEEQEQFIKIDIEQLRQNKVIGEDDEVVDVIFGEDEITVKEARSMGLKGLGEKKDTEKIKVKYPQVVTIRDENIGYQILIKSIKFLNKKGAIKKDLPIKRYIPDEESPSIVQITKNKKYISTNNIIHEIRGEVKKAETLIFNLNGELICQIEHPYRHLYVSPDGKYIIGANSEPSNAAIGIYSQNGLVKKIKKDFPLWNVDFSKDGSYFAITVGTKIKDKNEYRVDLIVMTKNGNKIWKKNDLTRGTAAYNCPVSISNDDIITVMTGMEEYKVYHFDKDGNLISEEQGDLELLRQFDK